MYWQKINSNDEVIGVCRPYNFVRTAKESIIFDMAKKNQIKFCICDTMYYICITI